MKKYVCLIFLVLMTTFGCENYDVERLVQAEVLCINQNILEGKMIGNFLGSSDGTFSNDVIKIGVKVEFGGEIWLKDFRVKHAVLVYHKDKRSLPVRVRLYEFGRSFYLQMYLGHDRMLRHRLEKSFAKKMYAVETMKK